MIATSKSLNKRYRRPRLIIATAAIGVACLCLPASSSAKFVWNLTASAPRGVYVIEHETWKVGDRVAVQPPPSLSDDLEQRGILSRGKLLIKRVAAGEGDTICRDALTVTVNGSLAAVAKSMTSDGVPLPVWQGCRVLGGEQVFLLGDTDNSFDGRYFNVTRRDEIVGRVSLLIPFP